MGFPEVPEPVESASTSAATTNSNTANPINLQARHYPVHDRQAPDRLMQIDAWIWTNKHRFTCKCDRICEKRPLPAKLVFAVRSF